MKARIWTAACGVIAIGTTAAVLAQDPPSPPSSQSTSAKTITVTGCVQRAPQEGTATGTTGTRETTPSASQTKFILTSAMSAAGTTGTSGTMPSTASATEYRLDTDESKLTPHVGHKVEITGTLEQSSRSGSSTSASTSSSSNAPTLKVDSVKMVSSTCS